MDQMETQSVIHSRRRQGRRGRKRRALPVKIGIKCNASKPGKCLKAHTVKALGKFAPRSSFQFTKESSCVQAFKKVDRSLGPNSPIRFDSCFMAALKRRPRLLISGCIILLVDAPSSMALKALNLATCVCMYMRMGEMGQAVTSTG